MESRNLDQLSLKVLMTRQITLRVYNRASSWLPARTAQVPSQVNTLWPVIGTECQTTGYQPPEFSGRQEEIYALGYENIVISGH